MANDLKQRYEEVCAEYVSSFAKKHSLKFDPENMWTYTVGDLAWMDKMAIPFNAIVVDINKDVFDTLFWKWFDYYHSENSGPKFNYDIWLLAGQSLMEPGIPFSKQGLLRDAKALGEMTGISFERMLVKTNGDPNATTLKHTLWYYWCYVNNVTLKKVAEVFDRRNHTTVRDAVIKVRGSLSTDPEYQEALATIKGYYKIKESKSINGRF